MTITIQLAISNDISFSTDPSDLVEIYLNKYYAIYTYNQPGSLISQYPYSSQIPRSGYYFGIESNTPYNSVSSGTVLSVVQEIDNSVTNTSDIVYIGFIMKYVDTNNGVNMIIFPPLTVSGLADNTDGSPYVLNYTTTYPLYKSPPGLDSLPQNAQNYIHTNGGYNSYEPMIGYLSSNMYCSTCTCTYPYTTFSPFGSYEGYLCINTTLATDTTYSSPIIVEYKDIPPPSENNNASGENNNSLGNFTFNTSNILQWFIVLLAVIALILIFYSILTLNYH